MKKILWKYQILGQKRGDRAGVVAHQGDRWETLKTPVLGVGILGVIGGILYFVFMG